jgi:hypothetical protein
MLHWAAENGHIGVIDALAAVGANVNIQDAVRDIYCAIFARMLTFRDLLSAYLYSLGGHRCTQHRCKHNLLRWNICLHEAPTRTF